MNSKKSPIVAKVIFKNGKTVHFQGNRYEKDDCNVMVYKLRIMLLKLIHKIDVIQMFDNRILSGDRMIFEHQYGVNLKNNLKSYLGDGYDPKL